MIDLGKVDMRGRVDALAARVLDKATESIPELKPFVDEHRKEIHARLNELAGPHRIDMRPILDHVDNFRKILKGGTA